MLIRAKFCKLEPVRFISHLELMTTWRRAFRRAQLPAAYSEGYNPRIKLAAGPPISVGMIGYGEYFDLELTTKMAPRDFCKQLNLYLPAGLRVMAAREISSWTKSLQAVVNCAVYLFKMQFSEKINEKKVITRFLNQSQIMIIRKRRKKKNRKLDIRPLIYRIEINENGLWKFTVSTGSQGNVRPRELSVAFSEFEQRIKEITPVRMIREELFVKKGNNYYQPFSDEVIRR